MNSRKRLISLASSLLTAAVFSAPSHATLFTFDDEGSFSTAISGLTATTVNFDSLTAGDGISSGDTVGGITFTYSLPYGLAVADDFDTTSTANYLGIDAYDGQFEGGDEFSMGFGSPMSAIGLYITSASLIFDGDITLTTNSGLSVDLLATVDAYLSDGEAYFIGLYTDDVADAFTSVSFSSFEEQFFYNVDDITYASASSVSVSEPASIFLLSAGLLGLRLRKKK